MRALKIIERPDPDIWMWVEITGWEWEYSFSVPIFEGPDPASEDDGLTVYGRATVARYKEPLAVRLRILAAGEYLTPGPGREPLKMVGSMQRIKGGFEGMIIAPKPMLPSLATMLAGGHFRGLELALHNVMRLHYDISRYSFSHSATAPETSD
jgi:hypothetical protein